MKKVLVVLFVSLFLLVPLFAEDTTYPSEITSKSWTSGGSVIKNPFAGVIGYYLQIIIGVVGGALMGLRFTIEMTHALIMNSYSDGMNEVKKVVIKFVIHIGVAIFGATGMFLLLSGLAG